MTLERGRWFAFTLVLFSVFGLVPGMAEVIPIAHAADYDVLMREGVAFRRAGDDSSALKQFQDAYELRKTPKALAQIGFAEQALGRWGSADKHLRQALESGDDPWIRKNRIQIDEALLVVAPHVGQLQVMGLPTGADVRVDGELVGQLPLEHPITATAGGVAIEVKSPGYLTIVRAATVESRTLTRETFKLQALSPRGDQVASGAPGPADRNATRPSESRPKEIALSGAGKEQSPPAASVGSSSDPLPGLPPAVSTDAPPRPASGISGQRVAALVAGGLSLGVLTFALIEHVSWQQRVNSFDSKGCGASLPNLGGGECRTLNDEGSHARLLAFVGYGATAALAATALILFVTDPGVGSGARSVACAPISTTTPGLGCAVRF